MRTLTRSPIPLIIVAMFVGGCERTRHVPNLEDVVRVTVVDGRSGRAEVLSPAGARAMVRFLSAQKCRSGDKGMGIGEVKIETASSDPVEFRLYVLGGPDVPDTGDVTIWSRMVAPDSDPNHYVGGDFDEVQEHLDNPIDLSAFR